MGVWNTVKARKKLALGGNYGEGPLPFMMKKGELGSGGIRTHASEETGALKQRLRPLGHATRYGKPNNSSHFPFH